MHVNANVGPDRRGRPLGRWKDRGNENMSERSARQGKGQEQARNECSDREMEDLMPWPTFWEVFPEEVGSRDS